MSGLVENYGEAGLFLFAFLEAFIQPFPVDPFITGAIAFGMTTGSAIISASIGSLFGSLTGYYLGMRFGEKLFLSIFPKKTYDYWTNIYHKFEGWALFGGAVTPIPYKVVVWISGMFEMDLKKFIIISFFSRALRYSVVGFLSEWFLKLIS